MLPCIEKIKNWHQNLTSGDPLVLRHTIHLNLNFHKRSSPDTSLCGFRADSDADTPVIDIALILGAVLGISLLGCLCHLCRRK